MMQELQHILTGTDFTESSHGAVREALRIVAGDPGRKVTVLHVAESISDAVALRAQIRQWVSELPEYADLHSPEQVLPDLELGKVAAGLSRCAQRIGATKVVVGPRPRTFVERWFTGAIAEQLFRTTKVPVLATRAPATGGYASILVPVDFSPTSEVAVKVAMSLLQNASGVATPDASIRLLHVAPSHAAGPGKDMDDSMRRTFQRQLHQFASDLGAEKFVSDYRVAFGVVQDVIPREVGELDNGTQQLVCMATRSSGSLFGSTADAVLRNIQVALLVVWHNG